MLIDKFKKKSFLDMSKAKIISQSIVLIEKNFKGSAPIGNFNIQMPNNPFTEISSLGLLKRVVREIFKKDLSCKTNEIPHLSPIGNKVFSFEDKIVFSYEYFPPKFSIQYNENTEETEKIFNIFKELIIDNEELKRSIFAIGLNFDMFIENEKEEIQKILFKDNFSTNLQTSSISLQYKLDGILTNFQINDFILNDKRGVAININFHQEINNEDDLMTLFLKKNLINLAKDKISSLIPNG